MRRTLWRRPVKPKMPLNSPIRGYIIEVMYQIQCAACNKKFEHRQNHTKTCSKECRNKIYYGDTRSSLGKGIPSGTVGAMTEMKVAIDLMEKGYAVFRALSPACFCDLIATKDDMIFKIEARTGYITGSKRYLFTKSKRDRIDMYAVYFGWTNKIIYFELDGKTEKEL